MVITDKFSTAQVEGMITVNNSLLRKSDELDFTSGYCISGIGDMLSKTFTVRSRQKNIVPCEP